MFQHNLDNLILASGGLATGTTAGTVKTVNTLQYAINNILYTKAATDNIAFTLLPFVLANKTAAFTNIPIGQSCLFILTIDSTGTVKAIQGNPVATGSGFPLVWPDDYLYVNINQNPYPGANTTSLTNPITLNGGIVLGGIRVDNASAGVFTPGTTAFGAAGITSTYYNFMQQPTINLVA